MADVECFSAHSTCCMAAGDEVYWEGRLYNKGKTVKVSNWVPHAQETEPEFTVACILVLATYVESRGLLSDLVAKGQHTVHL